MIHLDENEKIVTVVRRHWLAFVVEVIFIVLGALLPYVAYVFRFDFASLALLKPIVLLFSQPYIFLLSSLIWFQFLLIILFIALSDHYLDSWIITNARIIDIEQKGTFSRTLNSFRYDSIADVTLAKQNNLEKLFRYGTLCIKKTSGKTSDESDLSISEIRQPEKIRATILDEQRKSLNRLAEVVRNQVQ